MRRHAVCALAVVALAIPVSSAAGARQGTIAYASFPPAGDAQLYAIDASGGRTTRLIRHAGGDSEPSWSPDGRRIAFTSTSSNSIQGLFVANADGSAIRQLTRHRTSRDAPFLDAHPRWSPDGRRLLFHRYRNNRTTLYLVNADGSAVRRIGSGFEPAWSPDGSRIAFADRIGQFGKYDLYVANPDGTARQRITRNSVNDNDPDWSPDGLRLVFESNRNENTDVYTIRLDGRDERRLTWARGHDVSPVWSPNGRWIAFASRRVRAQFDIWVMNADGSDQTPLTRDPISQDAQPAWRPAR
ncbi:MAG: hypothetical protein MSC30_17000 [Gaiellaceae bacterium MAG52_C11]|nr:hypothetical protein [Candidatus Gaiellasilicea maunaloa]